MSDPLLSTTDPLTVAITWALTWGAGKLFDLAEKPKLRRALPMVAVLVALLVRTVIATVEGNPVTLELLGRGLIDGAMAVLGHSQFREVLKVIAPAEAPAEAEGGEE